MSKMKQIVVCCSLAMMICLPVRSYALIPIIDIIKGAVKKVVKQIDLQVQKLQNKTIALQNAQKVLENKLSETKLNEIGGWMERQRKLYQDYYEELKKVKATITAYQAVRNIITQQEQIITEYQRAYNSFQRDGNFTREELNYMYRVYTGILNASAQNLDQLWLVVNSFQTQMTDGKRLELIQAVAVNMQRNLSDLRRFNSQNSLLSMQRSRERKDVGTLQQLYGFPVKP